MRTAQLVGVAVQAVPEDMGWKKRSRSMDPADKGLPIHDDVKKGAGK